MPQPQFLRQRSSRQRKPLSKEELAESSVFDRGSRTAAPIVRTFGMSPRLEVAPYTTWVATALKLRDTFSARTIPSLKSWLGERHWCITRKTKARTTPFCSFDLRAAALPIVSFPGQRVEAWTFATKFTDLRARCSPM